MNNMTLKELLELAYINGQSTIIIIVLAVLGLYLAVLMVYHISRISRLQRYIARQIYTRNMSREVLLDWLSEIHANRRWNDIVRYARTLNEKKLRAYIDFLMTEELM